MFTRRPHRLGVHDRGRRVRQAARASEGDGDHEQADAGTDELVSKEQCHRGRQ